MKRTVLLAILTLVLVVQHSPAAWGLSLIAPIPGPVVRPFNAPTPDWLPGHRGVDLLGTPGEQVVAAGAGTISYAGMLAGRGVLVISHGDLRTTYEPVNAQVKVGDSVTAGQAVGSLADGHSCPGGTCLHWGLKRGDEYLNPLDYLDNGSIRLLPAEAVTIAESNAAARRAALQSGSGIPGLFSRPANGEIGSGFGMRMHPIFNELRMHQGVDISAGCGTPIRAAAAGQVEHVGYDDSGGNRLIINHGQVGGHILRTSYLHAQGYQVHPGDKVKRGQVVGQVGTTGWSTGCHLHFSVTVDGQHRDPAKFL
jgi:murein DD-endopeptidase MepM/ murein hydrolase activator NlpD